MPGGSLWDVLDSPKVTQVLADAGILDEFKSRVDGWLAKAPEGAKPEAEVLRVFLSESIAKFPGAVKKAIDEVVPQLFAAVTTGRGPVSTSGDSLA